MSKISPREQLENSILQICAWVEVHGWKKTTQEKTKTTRPLLYAKLCSLEERLDSEFLRIFKNQDIPADLNFDKWEIFCKSALIPYADVFVEILRKVENY